MTLRDEKQINCRCKIKVNQTFILHYIFRSLSLCFCLGIIQEFKIPIVTWSRKHY